MNAPNTPKRIIFLCERNATRSVMAAAWLQKHLDGHEVTSAGLAPDDTVDPFAAGMMMEAAIDITDHEPAPLDPALLDADTLVIALSRPVYDAVRAMKAGHPAFSLEYWDLPAPPSGDLPRDMLVGAYRGIFTAIKTHANNRFGAGLA